jgi:hypothetical protein
MSALVEHVAQSVHKVLSAYTRAYTYTHTHHETRTIQSPM